MSKRMGNKVFMSYSRKDHEWLERFQTWLKPLERKGLLDIWDDTKIKAGAHWKDEIKKALASAKVAVLLVSQNFLASDFIIDHELQPLLDAAANEGLTILWVPISHSLFDETDIGSYQAAQDPKDPLDSLSNSELNRVMAKISKQIKDAANP
jgi:internalin A